MRPIILRFFSGSVTPVSAFKNWLLASTNLILIFKCRLRVTLSFSPSFFSQNPVVDENTGQFLTDALVDENGSNR